MLSEFISSLIKDQENISFTDYYTEYQNSELIIFRILI